MRILLLNPPILADKPIADPFWGAPLGLAYLAASVSEEGHDVSVIDCLGSYPFPVERRKGRFRYGFSDAEIVLRATRLEPDIVGITCPYQTSFRGALETCYLIKREYSREVPVVAGGAHASVEPGTLLSGGAFDFVVVGEGENTFTELCRQLSQGGESSDVAGLAIPDRYDGFHYTAPRERILDLDSLPFPRRDLLPMEEYFKVDRSRFWHSVTDMRLPKTSLITSRGCPENCVFCAIRSTWGRKWVPRSAGAVVDEIESVIDQYGIREVNFLDDSIAVSRRRMEELCWEMIDRGLEIKWVPSSGVAIRNLDEDLLRLMKRSGCYRLSFGLESGDPDVLSFIRKRYTYQHALKVIEAANRLGIWTTGSFIYGFPYETGEQMERTTRFAIESGIDFAFFYTAVPYPGTELKAVCESEGLEVPPDADLTAGGVRSLSYSREEILDIRNNASRRLLLDRAAKPWKVVMKIRSFEDLGYVARVGLFFVTQLFGALSSKLRRR